MNWRKSMDLVISTVAQGLLWALLAIGVYLTFRVLDIADLTVEGSFPLGAAVAAIALVLIGVGVSHANSNGASDADTTSATSSDSSTGITQSEMESLLNNDTSRFSGDWKSDDGHYELSITKGGGFVKDLKDPNATAAAMTFLVNADGTLDSKQHPGYKLTLTDDTHLTLVNTNDNTQISFTFQPEREDPRQNKDFTGNWVYKAGDTTVAEVEITEDSYTITANGETETHTVTITDESGTGLEWCDDQGNLGDIQYADNGTDIKVTAFNIIDPTSLNRQGADHGTQYRTGIYCLNDSDLNTAQTALKDLQKRYTSPVVVECLPLKCFYTAEEYHQKYLDKNPGGYCHVSLGMIQKAKNWKPGDSTDLRK